MKRQLETKTSHSPEVEELLRGRLPFVARHGVTVVIVALAILGALFFFYGGTPRRMILGVVSHVVGQMNIKY